MDLHALLALLVKVCEELEIAYAITGSAATMMYGEPRLTNDIDILIDLSPEDVSSFLSGFPDRDFYVSPDAARNAISRRHQFNIIHPASGLKIDCIVSSGSALDRSTLNRKRAISFSGTTDAKIASPEDVILNKLRYFRAGGSEKHIRDILGVLKVQQQRVDREICLLGSSGSAFNASGR